MARKPHDFYEVIPDGVHHPKTPAERRDARAQKADKRSLEELTGVLLGMTRRRRAALGLDDDILEAVEDLARQGRKPSRARQSLYVQGLLRRHGIGRLREALANASMDAGSNPVALRWRRDLLEGGDDVLHAFMERHPDADRQQLRALVRRARSEGQAARRASRKLLQELITAQPAGEE